MNKPQGLVLSWIENDNINETVAFTQIERKDWVRYSSPFFGLVTIFEEYYTRRGMKLKGMHIFF